MGHYLGSTCIGIAIHWGPLSNTKAFQCSIDNRSFSFRVSGDHHFFIQKVVEAYRVLRSNHNLTRRLSAPVATLSLPHSFGVRSSTRWFGNLMVIHYRRSHDSEMHERTAGARQSRRPHAAAITSQGAVAQHSVYGRCGFSGPDQCGPT